MDAALAFALAALALPPAPRSFPGAVEEITRVEALWVDPAPAEPEECRPAALLDLPPGWRVGDAAAVVLSLRGEAPEPRGARLGAALLAQGTAVLEVASGGGACAAASGPGPRHPARREPLADLFGGLRAVVEQAGAGLVVAIGLGGAGGAVLLAAARDAEETAQPPSPSPGEKRPPRFAAAVAIGGADEGAGMPPVSAVARGAPPRPEEHWELRGPLLCGMLERVAAADGPGGGRDTGMPGGRDCMAALFPAASSGPSSPAAGAPRRSAAARQGLP